MPFVRTLDTGHERHARAAIAFDYCFATTPDGKHERDGVVDSVAGRRGRAAPEAVQRQRPGRTGRDPGVRAIGVGHGRPGRARSAGKRETGAAAARPRGRRPTAGRLATVPGENGKRVVRARQTNVGRHAVGRFDRLGRRRRAARRVRPVPPTGQRQTVERRRRLTSAMPRR